MTKVELEERVGDLEEAVEDAYDLLNPEEGDPDSDQAMSVLAESIGLEEDDSDED